MIELRTVLKFGGVMSEKNKYRTKQREELLEYLKQLHGAHITALELCEHFSQAGSPIGKATVYRQLEQLAEEGVVYKYVFETGQPSCYEYVPEDSHCKCEMCFHCKCERCGQLFHLHSRQLEELTEELTQKHHFRMDPRRTVFIGVCEQCSDAGR